VTLTARTTETL